MRALAPLLPLLRDDESAFERMDDGGWDLVVRQADAAGLQAKLRERLDASGKLASVPERPRRHLDAARVVAARHAEQILWETGRVQLALGHIGIPAVLLKGAAYLNADLPAARGRVFTDIDILVPRGALDDTERALRLQGWIGTALDAYDQRYYREWMHELPPLTHALRQTMLDVHHTILPPTAPHKPDPRKLMDAALPLEGFDALYVPCACDMVIHSATHLFQDSELSHGLRDLLDLDDLCRHFAVSDPDFWQTLPERAREMDLAGPVYYGLRYAQRFFHTPVPDAVARSLSRAGPGPLMRPVMDALFDRGLAPHHRSCDDWFSPAARWLLYVRSHYLRMPLHLLLPHLVRKAWKRHVPKAE